jgi:hypothetical protein
MFDNLKSWIPFHHFLDGQGDYYLLGIAGCRNGRDKGPPGKYVLCSITQQKNSTAELLENQNNNTILLGRYKIICIKYFEFSAYYDIFDLTVDSHVLHKGIQYFDTET